MLDPDDRSEPAPLQRLRRLIRAMSSRLDASQIEDIEEYVDFSEAQLALEYLADSLGAVDASISPTELEEFRWLVSQWPVEPGRLDFLAEMVDRGRG